MKRIKTRVRATRYERDKASGLCVDCRGTRSETLRCQRCRERVNRTSAAWQRRVRGREAA